MLVGPENCHFLEHYPFPFCETEDNNAGGGRGILLLVLLAIKFPLSP